MPASFTTTDKLYILDFFDDTGEPPGQCSHGRKVLEVVRQTLDAANADQLYSNVVSVELDYFRHQASQDHYLTDYIVKQKPNIQPTLAQIHDVLRHRDLSTVGAFETPLLYLQAIYDAALSDPSASVVTSSFYTESAGFSLLPPRFNASNTLITLSAVDDNPGYIETFPLEPIHSLYSARHDDGVLLVGGLAAGVPFGMTSSQGDGVSLLGKGDGWGNGSTCIQPSDKGTSFAAPQIATVAYLTRALWKAQNTNLNPLQLRDRLLRSTPVSWTTPPGYSAPGTPDTMWATTGKYGTLVYSSGMSAAISALSGSVTYSYLTSPGQFQMPIQATNGGVSGIQHSGSDFLIFDNTQQRWIKVNLQGLQLNITLTNGQSLSILTINNFMAQLNAITLF
jgi:hypothetical protein